LELLYSRLYEPLIRELGWKFHLTREDAGDIIQDTFALGVERLSKKGNPMVWLRRVAYQLALNFVRTDARRADLLARWGPHDRASLLEPGSSDEDAEEAQ